MRRLPLVALFAAAALMLVGLWSDAGAASAPATQQNATLTCDAGVQILLRAPGHVVSFRLAGARRTDLLAAAQSSIDVGSHYPLGPGRSTLTLRVSGVVVRHVVIDCP